MMASRSMLSMLLRCTVFWWVAATAALSFSSNNTNNSNKIIPITIISGFLGSGKTTLLQHLLHNQEGLRIAVIVNDVASVNIDSKLISGGSSSSSSLGAGATAAGMVELQNGCACCSLSDELLASVSELVTLSDLRGDDESFHHIVVELSGVADPKSVRAKFQEAILYDMPLMERVRLDTLTTVVDCSVFLQHLKSSKGATPKDAPELFYRDGQPPNEDEQPDWMEGMPAPLIEALMAGEQAYGAAAAMGSSDDGVADLLVTQTETADVVLLNKVDLVESETSQRIEQIVRALNPRATVMPTEFGIVPPNKILASAGGKGVVEAGVVDDHRDAVEAAAVMASTDIEQELSHRHEHVSQVECNDPGCTDPTHSHSHNHEHSSGDCTDPDCTDQSHSHSHSHATEDCTDPNCADPSHSHSHTHTHGGIGTYVYRARRPFHPGRLVSFLRHLPVSRGLPEDAAIKEAPLKIPGETETALKSVLRSKGFVWCADSNVAALYWSHAGSSFEMQCLGRWWATLPRAQWPEEAASIILADFDNPNHEEGESESVGDRRQEVVFIGSSLGEARKQKDICTILNQCLLTDSEWKTFRANVGNEDKLRSMFVNPIKSRMVSY